MKKIFLMLLTGLLLVGCDSNEPTNSDDSTVLEGIVELTQNTAPVFDDEAQKKVYAFNAPSTWIATVEEAAKDWLSVSPTSGEKGTYNLTFQVKLNEKKTKRTGKITFKGEDLSFVITVTQDGDFDICSVMDDEDFKAYCLKNFDTDGNGKLSLTEGKSITKIDVRGTTEYDAINGTRIGKGTIKSLKGIEYFPNLHTLQCDYNQITSLDVSANILLDTLSCNNNPLTSLDVSKNMALTYLGCGTNQLISLDVSKNTALTYLFCSSNQLTELDVSKNTALTTLICYYNPLTSLDVSKNTTLTTLSCGFNQLTDLDVSNNMALTYLACNNNPLTSLDVSKNTALTDLVCVTNQLTVLDVSNNTALTRLFCTSNQLTELDVSNNTALTSLDCYGNNLFFLDVSNNMALANLNCAGNPLQTLYMATGQTINALEKPTTTNIVYK